MTYKIVTQEARTVTAKDFVSDIGEGVDGHYVYYVFLGKHTQYAANSDVVTEPIDTDDFKRHVYDDMMFGKKVTPNDARVMINRYDYVINTIYDKYDDADPALHTKPYFVCVKRSNDYDVFKCLDNNRGAPSTIPPNKLDLDANGYDEIYRTSDGYVWKYMYTVPSADMLKFATDTLIPVIANAQVTSTAVDGTIDVIEVLGAGSRYDNHLAGTLGPTDIGIDNNRNKVNVSANNKASTSDDFYKGCIFKVISGTGEGTFGKVESYDVYGNMKVVTLDTELDLDSTSEFEITPEVVVQGDILGDADTVTKARARAIISDVGNTVSYVEMLNRGKNYRIANAHVYYSGVVPVVSNAAVRPIISPSGGHGYNANAELNATKACFSVTFNETSDNLPSINDFRQVGVISSPSFANVTIKFSSKDSVEFNTGETAYEINPIRLYASGVTVELGSNSVTASSGSFDNLSQNTMLYIVSDTGKQLAMVSGVTNSTFMTLDAGSHFACTDCEMYLANVSVHGTVTADIFEGVGLSGLKIPLSTGKSLVGYESGAHGVIQNMQLANTATDFSTFNQMWKYYVSTSDAFEPDEIIYQPTAAANSHGNLFGIVDADANKIMYLTNQFSYINTGQEVIGLTSGDTASVISSYEPDLKYTSGRILYLENIEKVARQTGQKETFKIIFSY